jgi:tripartite-type tricarboxylate transporter receptor subunit TctC
MKHFVASFVILFLFATVVATAAETDTYPSRPIHVILANSVGGTSDIFIRALALELQKRLGQPIVVENRTGGAMNIAGRACADATPDGYSICLLPSETLTLNPYIYKSVSYDAEKDFVPITNAFINQQVMVVSATLGVKNLDELARLSKEKPGTLSYSALSVPLQIGIEEWKKKSGADLVYVPVRGGADMVNGLLTGTTPVAIVGLPNFAAYIRNGQVVPIAVDTESRSPLFPSVPTLEELGFPKLPSVYFAFVAPSGVPREIVRKLHDEIAAAGSEPDFRRRQLTDIGLIPVFDTPDHLATFLAEERESNAKLIRESGFQPR